MPFVIYGSGINEGCMAREAFKGVGFNYRNGFFFSFRINERYFVLVSFKVQWDNFL